MSLAETWYLQKSSIGNSSKEQRIFSKKIRGALEAEKKMDIISKKSAVYCIPHPAIRTLLSSARISTPYSMEETTLTSEGLALPWLLKERDYPPSHLLKRTPLGWKAFSLTSARAKPKELLNRIKHGRYPITGAPHLVFCSLTLPGILMMLFRLHFLFFICIF